VVVFTEQEDIDASLAKILDYLQEQGLIQVGPELPGSRRPRPGTPAPSAEVHHFPGAKGRDQA